MGPDYVVTGNPDPDCKGDYYEDGEYGGEKAYRREDSAYWLWYAAPAMEWRISTGKGVIVPGYWANPTIVGVYEPEEEYSGKPEVSLPP